MLFLVKNGVPWDVAWGMEEDYRRACFIIFGKFEGSEFDWEKKRFLTFDEKKS